MKKVVAMLCIMVLFLAGCGNKVYTYGTEAGDMLHFTFKESGGYEIAFQERFIITRKDELQTVGEFMAYYEYDYKRSLLAQDPTIEILELESPYQKCCFWKESNKEYNIMFVVDETMTCVMMRNGVSEESARACFERLKITGK